MMSPFRKLLSLLAVPGTNRRGSGILEGISLISIIAFVSVVLTGTSIFFSRSVLKKVMNTRAPLQNTTVAETVLLAYRFAQMRYVKWVADSSCTNANSFLVALKSGSGCVGSLSVFSGVDYGTQESPPLYTFSGAGCTINQTSSSCATGSIPILNTIIANQTQLYSRAVASGPTIAEVGFDVYLVAIRPETSLIEFSTVSSTSGVNTRFGFALRDGLPNSAHLDSGVHPDHDTNLIQMAPDPQALCPGGVGGSYLLYAPGSGCFSFPHTKTSSGLAYFANGYFGLRNFQASGEGQIVNLRSGDLVNADGTSPVDGSQVFPAHTRSMLSNVDDITLVEDEIYYVGFQGDSSTNVGTTVPIPSTSNLSTTQIGTFVGSGASATRQIVCDLGAQKWGTHFNGLAAASWSDTIAPGSNGTDDRMSVFYTKSDSGQLLTSVVLLPQGASQYTCFTFLDPNLQNADFVRTNGFDRTPDSKPYYIF